jgi:hypothetical protein
MRHLGALAFTFKLQAEGEPRLFMRDVLFRGRELMSGLIRHRSLQRDFSTVEKLYALLDKREFQTLRNLDNGV